MQLNESAYLCYSLNVFPRLADGYLNNIKSIAGKFCEIRRKLGLDDEVPFALGFWLDADAVEELQEPEKISKLKNFLEENNFYVFTVNAFPYGKFHDGPVKDNVYLPNWTSDLRKDFTCKVADILAQLLPDGIIGSISTLPGGYKEHLALDFADKVAENLSLTADYLSEIEEDKGKKIILGIEMEPDCIWESPSEFCEFRNKYLKSRNSMSYIGVCYDTCHQELLEGTPGSGLQLLREENVPIAKIQFSAALRGNVNDSGIVRELANFADSVYLHQTRFFNKDNEIVCSLSDSPEHDLNKDSFYGDSVVVHFHMPLYADEVLHNFNVAKGELCAVLDLLKKDPSCCSNLEIETYTYKVLPDVVKAPTTEDMIFNEYNWILQSIK